MLAVRAIHSSSAPFGNANGHTASMKCRRPSVSSSAAISSLSATIRACATGRSWITAGSAVRASRCPSPGPCSVARAPRGRLLLGQRQRGLGVEQPRRGGREHLLGAHPLHGVDRMHHIALDGHRPLQNGAPGLTRTGDTQFRKLLLYPPELRGRIENPQTTERDVLRRGNLSTMGRSVGRNVGRDGPFCAVRLSSRRLCQRDSFVTGEPVR